MIIQPNPFDGPRALTVRQPYASEILSGVKTVEFRSWPTNYRGDILITASAARVGSLPVACTLCVVNLWDCTGRDDDWEWHLRNPRAVPQLPVKGKLKLWRPDADLFERLGLTLWG